MSQLLISVRNAEEALAALAGGADWIDVKEPGRGPLGHAGNDVIRAVLAAIADRRPVSAACGELIDEPAAPPKGVQLAKVGLSNAGADWEGRWRRWRERLNCGAVAVAYADDKEVNAPPVRAVLALAVAERANAFLIDTAVKDGRRLLDHFRLSELAEIAANLHENGIPLALGGSLTADDLGKLSEIVPNWFAVRGAACIGGRTGQINAGRVRGLAQILASPCSGQAGRIG